MSDLLKKLPAGEIVAENVSVEGYLANYTGTETRYEWIEGYVIQMSPNTIRHNHIIDYLRNLLTDYFRLKPIGIVEREIGVKSSHAVLVPDLTVFLGVSLGNPDISFARKMPDICIEVVSRESSERDYQDKAEIYQQWGIHEYWVIDPLTQQSTFYRIQAGGAYAEIALDANTNYQTSLLPKLKIHVPTLWQFPLPHHSETWLALQTMFAEE